MNRINEKVVVNKIWTRACSCAAAAALIFAFAAAGAIAAGSENLALNSKVTSSSTPNPVWGAAKAADDSIGPTDGWLGEWAPGTAEEPWIGFTLPGRTMVSEIDVIAASLTQAGKNRFARPKKVRVDFFDVGDIQQLEFDIKDDETQFQNLKFAAIPADTVKITIEDVYPGTHVDNSTGFEEVKIFGTPAQAAGLSPTGGGVPPASAAPRPGMITQPPANAGGKSAPSTISQPAPGEPDNESAPSDGAYNTPLSGGGAPASGNTASAPKGTLDPEEKQILDTLRQLLVLLEKKFMED